MEEKETININLNLDLNEVNTVLAVLAKAPYEVSVGIIDKIKVQAIPQLPPQQEE